MTVISIKNFTLDYSAHRGVECTAPCSVYSVLLGHGLIEDPLYRENQLIYKDNAESLATFTARFSVDGGTFSSRCAVLRLGALDFVSRVTLNGAEVFSAGFGASGAIDVKDKVKLGENELKLEFSNLADEPKSDCDSPRFPDAVMAMLSMGIFGKVELVFFDRKIIERVDVSQNHTDDGVTLSLDLRTLGTDESARAVATLVSPGGKVYYCGISDGEGSLTVNSPNLWWPNGLGVQNLYRLSVNLYCDGEIEDTYETFIALRTLSVVSEDGSTPKIEVNGVRFLTMGGSYVYGESISPELSAERMKDTLRDCKRANFNAVAIEGGRRPPEEFYSMCDRFGLVVLEDTKSINRYATGAATSETVSLPNMKTVRTFAADEDMNPHSPVMECHFSTEGVSAALAAAAQRYRYAYSFSDLVYMTQITESDNRECAIRKIRAERDGYTSAFVGQINDCYPAASGSSIDCFGRWKAAHYTTARLFAPVLVSATESEGRVTFNLANEARRSFVGTVTYSLFDAEGNVILSDRLSAEVGVMSCADVGTVDFSSAISGHERDYYLAFSAVQNSVELSKGTLLFTKPKYFNFKNPNIKCHISGAGSEFVLTLSAEAFAKYVEVDFEQTDATFEDNYFDITDKAPCRIKFKTCGSVSVEKLVRELTVKSVYDIGREKAERPFID